MEISKNKIIESYAGMFAGAFGGSFTKYAEPAAKKSCELALSIIEYLEKDKSEGYEEESERVSEFHNKCESLKTQLRSIINC